MKVGLCLTGIALVLASLIYFLNPFPTAIEQAEIAKIGADISGISQSLMTYKQMNGFLPSTSQGLEALVTKPSGDPMPENWYQFWERLPVDPWGNAYRYEQPGKHHPKGFDVYTTGGPRRRIIGNW